MPRNDGLFFGPFRLDAGTESLWRAGSEIRLRPKTFAVLRHLVERPGRLVTKDELLSAVWSDAAVGDAALTVCVNEIRRALGDGARAPQFVETVHRRGYRFIGSVRGPGGDEPGPVAIVGRDGQLGTLRGWLERARRGERRVGFVTGEAGIGKTALVETFLGTAGCLIAAGQCLDHFGAGEAYLPVLEALGRLARGPAGEQVVAVLTRRAPTWLAQMPGLVTPADAAALQARILGATRERMLREMAEALEALAAERPLVLVLEDLHWSDASTVDLIAAVARRRESARLLLLGTYRPLDAADHPLRAVAQELALHGACEELALPPLQEADVGRYLAARIGGEAEAPLTRSVHRRTEGLPLFMVNVVNTLLHDGLLVEAGGRWQTKSGVVDVETAVPASLRQMIERQLDRLGDDDRRLLEVGSVAGATFSAATLAAALDDTVEAVEERAEGLARREAFIRSCCTDEWPDGTLAACYTFRHVLYEQVLYERLPPARRASLHLRIAEREEAGYRARPRERAAALAVHFEAGRVAPRAIQHRRLAAEHALERCAYPEAVEHLARARALLETLPEGHERMDLELEVQVTLGPALIGVKSAAAPEVEDVYRRAAALAERLGDGTRLFRSVWGLWNVSFVRGHYRAAHELGERLLTTADPARAGQLLEAHHALWATLGAMGETIATLPHLEAGLARYDRAQHAPLTLLYGGHDAGVCCWEHLARARWLTGHPDHALEAMREAVALAEALGHPLTTVMALNTQAKLHYLRGDLEAARLSAERAASLTAIESWPDARVVLACVAIKEGRPGRPTAELCRELIGLQRPSPPRRNVESYCLLAEAACEAGESRAGHEALDAIPEAHREMFFAAEIERLRGELLQRQGRRDEAEGRLRHAVQIARARGERALELRAATSLARLLAGGQRGRDARADLAEICGRFTEGLDTADLRAARALL